MYSVAPSTIRRRASQFSYRRHWWLALALAAVLLITAAPPAAASQRTGPSKPVVQTGGSGVQPPASVTTAGPKALVPNAPCEDCNPNPPCYPEFEYCSTFFIWCKPSLTKEVSRDTDLETGEGFTKIHWTASWNCTKNYYLAHTLISSQVGLYDRTPGHDDQFLGYAGSVNGTDNASSQGDIFIYDNDFPGTQLVELTLESSLQMTGIHWSNTWQYCGEVSGLRYVVPCQGLGTQLLTLAMGTNSFSTFAPEKVRGGCYWPDHGYFTYGVSSDGFAQFSFWGMQRCEGTVQVHMEVGLHRESTPSGPALVTYRGDGQVTRLNPLVLGKGIITGSHVRVGERVKIIISTTLVAPGAARWMSTDTPSHHCHGEGTDTLICTDTSRVFAVPAPGR